jgi:segregation and condensation protein A
MALAALDLDLEVFQGPFDLLLTLVLKDEVDLLEVDLADVVLAYVDHLEARGELDLEAATEFLVLMASLLELKSRLMLPEAHTEPPEPDHGEAVEELLERLLEYGRYRGAAAHLRDRLSHEERFRYRSAPLPPALRRREAPPPRKAYEPDRLGEALRDLLRTPAPLHLSHLARPRVTVEARLAHLRGLLASRAAFSFDDAVAGADRVTEAVTLFALLELYKRGEAEWTQAAPFAPISVSAR